MTRGRDLPKYITRRKRDGVLLFRKRDGKRIVEIRLETQFPEGGRELPYTLARERANILRQIAEGRANPRPGAINPADLIDPDEPDKVKPETNYEDARYIPRHLRRAVYERDGKVCAYCGEETDWTHIDHVIPRSRGGKNTMENLVVACQPCNQSKANKTPEEWEGRRD